MATTRTNKAIQTYFTNSERELIKVREREERDRLKYLMNHDEENYRKLVDEKKNSRLALLLSQTDGYINNLKQLVRQHQETRRAKAPLLDQTVSDKTEESIKTTSENSQSTNQESKTT